MSVFDEERKKLGLTGKKNTGRSAFDDERINAGLIKDDRPKKTLPTKLVLEDTLKSVMKPTTKTIDFKADQKKKTATPLEGKLPAASLLVGDNNKKLQNTLKGKLPAPSLAMNNSGESKKDKSTVFDAIDNINAFTDRVKSSATLGGTKLVDQIFATKIGTKESKQDMKDKLARAENVKGGMIADVAGSLVSGKTAYELGGKLVTPIVKNAPKIVQKLVKGAAAGSAFEAPRQAHEILGERYGGEQQSLKQRGINVAVSAGMGGLADFSVGLGGLSASGIKNNLVSKAVGGAIGVGGIGASMGAANEVQQAVSGQQQSIGGRLKDVGKYAAIGAGIGLLGGAGASQLMKKSETPVQPIEEPIQEAPVRSTEPLVRQAEPIVEEPIQPKAAEPQPEYVPKTAREAEIIDKVNKKEELSQDDIDYLLQQPNEPTLKSEAKPIEEPKPIIAEVKSIADTKAKPILDEVEEAVTAANHPKVRDKVYNFADSAEKAARERIAKRNGQLNSTPLPEWTDYSIIMAAKLVKGTIKATNFTEELVKEFGEAIRPHATKILRMSKEEIRNQERAATKEGLDAVEFNAKAEGDVKSFSEKISHTAPKEKKPFSERWQQWRTQTTDDLAALEDVEKKVRGGKLASAEDSLYKSARMFKGAPEKAAQIVEQRIAPIVKGIEKLGKSVEDLEMYALAKHAEDVNAKGYKSGFTNQEIKAVLDELESPEMIAAQQELVKVNRDMLKNLVDNGVVTKELYDVLGDRWKNYIPLFREMNSEKVNFEGGMSKALANVTSPIKALQGSEKKVIAPLENMVKNIFQSVSAAERNNVSLQIPKLAELDTNNSFFRKLKTGEEVGQKNVVKVKVEGKDVHYEVEPEVYKALMNLDQESSNTLMAILAKPASLLRAGATLTPEFALRNPLRDINQAFVVSKSGFNPITDFGAGLIQTIKKGPLYKDWIDNLGAYGNTLSMDRNVHKKALETVLKQPISKTFVNLVNGKTAIHALRAISDATESATKVGEYRAALRSGASKQEAAFRSRDLMDFARAGSSIRPANRIVSFLNANIQGKSKLLRAVKENPGGVIARGFASVTLPTVGIFIANHKFANETQKNTLSNAPDWMRDSFWLMAIPYTDLVARIPKPFDLAAVFSNLPEKALQYTLDNDPEAFEGYVQRTLKESSLPSQISGILPFIEGMANYSFFKEGQIIPRAEQSLKFSDQYDPVRTSSTARLIAGGIEKATGGKGSFKNFSSPRIVDNTIQGLTAGVGKYASDAIDILLDTTGLYSRTSKTAKSVEQSAFTRSFLVDSNQGGKQMEQFYRIKDELTKDKTSSKLNGKPFYEGEDIKESDDITDITKDINKAAKKVDKSITKIRTKPLTKADQLDIVNDVSDTLSAINKAIKLIEKSSSSSSEKKRQIDPLVKQKNELVQKSNDFFKGKVIK